MLYTRGGGARAITLSWTKYGELSFRRYVCVYFCVPHIYIYIYTHSQLQEKIHTHTHTLVCVRMCRYYGACVCACVRACEEKRALREHTLRERRKERARSMCVRACTRVRVKRKERFESVPWFRYTHTKPTHAARAAGTRTCYIHKTDRPTDQPTYPTRPNTTEYIRTAHCKLQTANWCGISLSCKCN